MFNPAYRIYVNEKRKECMHQMTLKKKKKIITVKSILVTCNDKFHVSILPTPVALQFLTVPDI